MFSTPFLHRWWPRKRRDGKRIVILLHERTPKKRLHHYSISKFTPTWIEDGHQVIWALGTDRPIPGDLVIVHVDLSVVPERFLNYAADYPIALNARVGDIRKSRISHGLVGPDSAWAGPVIVKSDLNCAGLPERRLLGIDRTLRELRRPGETTLHFGQLDGYEIYESVARVPAQYFSDPGLVVEKFLPELRDGFYHLRTCHFLGRSSHGYLHRSRDPLVKMRNIVGRVPIETHADVEALRQRLGLDYGKIDYVVHDGQAIVLDVNKTTGGGRMGETAELIAARALRARALYDYWNGQAW